MGGQRIIKNKKCCYKAQEAFPECHTGCTRLWEAYLKTPHKLRKALGSLPKAPKKNISEMDNYS